MSLKFIPILIITFMVLNSSTAQTKKIAWKSHSGQAAYYASALEENMFDMDGSNFGVAPQREIITAQLDSLICISDSLAIMVTSEHCQDPMLAKKEKSKWRAGRDSVFYHPLFSKRHSLDSIKSVLHKQYYFRNQVQNTIFIGYDNGNSDSVNYTIPFSAAPVNRTKPTHGKKFFVLLAGLLLFTSVAASFSQSAANKPD